MFRPIATIFAVGFAVTVSQSAAAQVPADPSSLTLYAGPATTRWVTQILGGHFDVNGAMIGLAFDQRLVNLGSGISLAGEIQATQFGMGTTYATGAVGLGVRFDEFPWSDHLRTTIAIFSGPSYASQAPFTNVPFPHRPPRFLNYFGAEFGVDIPGTKSDALIRIYHRSGAWGLYNQSADVGSMIGIGLRRRF